MLVINLNNNQSRKKAWMQEYQWMWWLIHTDSYADTEPTYGVTEIQIRFKRPTIGMGHWNRAMGPPQK